MLARGDEQTRAQAFGHKPSLTSAQGRAQAFSHAKADGGSWVQERKVLWVPTSEGQLSSHTTGP
jgi:hypothetical protein